MITEPQLIRLLERGVRRTADLMALMTDYHGGPVRTEYLITGDIAREFVDGGFNVRVECLNRHLVNALVAQPGAKVRSTLRSRRTDLAVMRAGGLHPMVLIEVKIGTPKFTRRLQEDLLKITTTMDLMKAEAAARVFGVVVFQVHIPGSRNRYYARDFLAPAHKAEKEIARRLKDYAKAFPDFSFIMRSLQAPNAGAVERDLEMVGEELAWGEPGHATRYHAILVRSKRPVPPPATTLAELRERSRRSRVR
jgi:hypothetical protein